MELKSKTNSEIKSHLLEVFSVKKQILLSDNTKLQHQILNCNSYFKSPVKIELADCPIKKANLKKKKTNMHVYLMKNIIHEITNKTLAYVNSFFKKV